MGVGVAIPLPDLVGEALGEAEIAGVDGPTPIMETQT